MTCFSLAGLLIWESIDEANRNPVLTTVETVPVKDVPFPAVTIDSGDPDPWAPTERLFNAFTFESSDQLRELH